MARSFFLSFVKYSASDPGYSKSPGFSPCAGDLFFAQMTGFLSLLSKKPTRGARAHVCFRAPPPSAQKSTVPIHSLFLPPHSHLALYKTGDGWSIPSLIDKAYIAVSLFQMATLCIGRLLVLSFVESLHGCSSWPEVTRRCVLWSPFFSKKIWFTSFSLQNWYTCRTCLFLPLCLLNIQTKNANVLCPRCRSQKSIKRNLCSGALSGFLYLLKRHQAKHMSAFSVCLKQNNLAACSGALFSQNVYPQVYNLGRSVLSKYFIIFLLSKMDFT